MEREQWNFSLARTVPRSGCPFSEQPPRAGTGDDGSRCGGDAVMRRRLPVAPARQPVAHEALGDAYPLYRLLEHDEQQRDEPQQHQLYGSHRQEMYIRKKNFFELEQGLVQRPPPALQRLAEVVQRALEGEGDEHDGGAHRRDDPRRRVLDRRRLRRRHPRRPAMAGSSPAS
jgi:uncharacterized membrane protein YccC